MASGQFFDPMVLLRIAPLITSSASLSYCWAQNVFISIFSRPRNREKSNALLPTYIEDWFYGYTVLALSDSAKWYAAGAIFSAAHCAFVPAVAWKLTTIINNEAKGTASKC